MFGICTDIASKLIVTCARPMCQLVINCVFLGSGHVSLLNLVMDLRPLNNPHSQNTCVKLPGRKPISHYGAKTRFCHVILKSVRASVLCSLIEQS